MTTPDPKQTLRQQLRHQRQSIPLAQKQFAHQQIVNNIQHGFARLLKGNSGAYFGTHEEVNLQLLVDYCWQHKYPIYTPIVDIRTAAMVFQRVESNTPLIEKAFKIKEPLPDVQLQIEPQQLDLVFTPLVGFDTQGGRLGMGGGFYDRCFAFKKNNNSKPWLIGCAYEVQRVAAIDCDDWDIRLDAIVTEKQIYWVNQDLQKLC